MRFTCIALGRRIRGSVLPSLAATGREMTNRIHAGAAIAFAAALVAAPVGHAHHAFSAEFDAELPIRVQGKIVQVDWINPHAWVHVEHVEEDGTKQVWQLEAGTPNTLLRPWHDANAAATWHRSGGTRLPEQGSELRTDLLRQRTRHHVPGWPQVLHGIVRHRCAARWGRSSGTGACAGERPAGRRVAPSAAVLGQGTSEGGALERSLRETARVVPDNCAGVRPTRR